MPPYAPSVTTTGSTSTGMSSNVSDNPRSLKNYDLIDQDQLTAVVDVLTTTNFENCDISLVTTPNGFPPEKLSEILNHGNKTDDVTVDGDCYTVRDTSNTATGTNIVVPIPKSQSRYKCRTIPKCITVTRSMKNTATSELNFIPRPEFPKMSKNLIERFLPFGCEVTGSKVIELPSMKKDKKRKRKLQNEDETFNNTVDESPSKKKKNRKKTDISQYDKSIVHEHKHTTDIEHLQKMAKKKAKRARKEAKKAKKKRKMS